MLSGTVRGLATRFSGRASSSAAPAAARGHSSSPVARPAAPVAAAQRMAEGGPAPQQRSTFNVAIEGCCHGELDTIYSTLAFLEQKEGRKIDLLICCGDFQAIRNPDDLECMAVPDKYKHMMTFYKYYSGEKVAPYPTLFIGGNHEAVNYLWELHYGGWAAPNIYFLGYSGVVQFGGHRIAGLSGTYSAAHYDWGHFEAPPYQSGTLRSAYHVRRLHTHRLMQLRRQVDIFLSHDWPLRITRFGDSGRLFAKKPYFKAEAERDELGSQAAQDLLDALQPCYWFAAHLHCKFPAIVPHGPAAQGAAGPLAQAQAQANQKQTRFLALDKCLPRRDFLQVLELEVRGPLQLQYDPEWLAVLRATHHLTSLQRHPPPLPPQWGGRAGVTAEQLAAVEQLLEGRGGAAVPSNFVPTAAAYDASSGRRRGTMPRASCRNPQTEAFLEMLGLEYNLDAAGSGGGGGGGGGGGPVVAPLVVPAGAWGQQQQQQQPQGAGRSCYARPTVAMARNPEDIDLSDGEEEGEGGDGAGGGGAAAAAAAAAAGEEGAAGAAAAAALARAAQVLHKAGINVPVASAAAAAAAGAAAAAPGAGLPPAAAAGPALADAAEISLDSDED